ncbi:MAG: hypothetical protein AB7N61_26505 [Acidimicrobiia bacterium]
MHTVEVVGDYPVSVEILRSAFDRRTVVDGLLVAGVAGLVWCATRVVDDSLGIGALVYILGAVSLPAGVIRGARGRPFDKNVAAAVVPASLLAAAMFVYLIADGTDSGQRGLVFAGFAMPLAISAIGLGAGWGLGRWGFRGQLRRARGLGQISNDEARQALGLPIYWLEGLPRPYVAGWSGAGNLTAFSVTAIRLRCRVDRGEVEVVTSLEPPSDSTLSLQLTDGTSPSLPPGINEDQLPFIVKGIERIGRRIWIEPTDSIIVVAIGERYVTVRCRDVDAGGRELIEWIESPE